MSCQVQYSGTQPTMTEEELWDSVCGKEESPIVTTNGINGYCLGYWHNNPVTNYKNYLCKSCDKQYESKYISFPMIHVDLCSKECYTCYKSQLPEKIWGTIQLNNETLVIPFMNKSKPFTLLTNQEINNFCVPQATICGTNVVSTITNPQCSGMDNGSISVSVSGGAPGYTYDWGSSFANVPNIDSLSSGSYTLIISDSLLCDTIIYYDLSYATTLSLTTSSYNISCNGANDGSVSVTATGSTGYVYDWGSSFANVASLSGLSAGTYNVIVTDINGCIKSASTSITEPPADQVGYNYNSSEW